MVLFIGDFSSPKKQTNSNTLRTAARLIDWIDQLNTKSPFVLDFATVSQQNIVARLCKNNNCKVIALGQVASAKLAALNIAHYTLPHPSSKNKLLKSLKYVNLKLEEARTYLKVVK